MQHTEHTGDTMPRKLSKHVNVRCFHISKDGRRCIKDAMSNGRCSVHNVKHTTSEAHR